MSLLGGWLTRLHWGIAFTGAHTKDEPMLIGEAWCQQRQADILASKAIGDAPIRPLLFTRRKAAREWCRERHEFYRTNYTDGHTCRLWRFRPVRIRVSYAEVK